MPTTEHTEPRHAEYMNAKGRFQCSMCTNTYRHFKHLKRHLNSHTHEVVYECEDCGRRYSRGDLLQRHRRKCANSDDEIEIGSRARRRVLRRTDSFSSYGDDSDDSGSLGDNRSRASLDANFANSGLIGGDSKDANLRRSSRLRVRPRTYADDSLTSPQRRALAPLDHVAEAQPTAPCSPHISPLLTQDQLAATVVNTLPKLPAEWQATLTAPASPPLNSLNYGSRAQPADYDSQYFTERHDQMEVDSNEPGWISAMDNESSCAEMDHPASPAWENNLRGYPTALVNSFQNADGDPPMTGRPQFAPLENDTLLVDDKLGGFLTAIIPSEDNFVDFGPDYLWEFPNSNHVF